MPHGPKTAATLDALRAQIERGRYEVKPDRVAEAMLRRGVSFRSGVAPRGIPPRGLNS